MLKTRFRRVFHGCWRCQWVSAALPSHTRQLNEMARVPDDGQSLSALSLFVIQTLQGERGRRHSRLHPVMVGLPLIVSWMRAFHQIAEHN